MTSYAYKNRLAEFSLEIEEDGQTLIINCPKEMLNSISPEAIYEGYDKHPFGGNGRSSNVPKSIRRMLDQNAVCLLDFEGQFYYLGHWNKDCEFIEYRMDEPVLAFDGWQDHDLYLEPETD